MKVGFVVDECEDLDDLIPILSLGTCRSLEQDSFFMLLELVLFDVPIP